MNQYQGLLGLLAALTAPLAFTHDGEWPPEPDPYYDAASMSVQGNPAPGSSLHIDGFDLALPPSVTSRLHWHAVTEECRNLGFTGDLKSDFTVGDIDNDGIAHEVVIANGPDGVTALKMNFQNGTLDELWTWDSPLGQNHGPFSTCILSEVFNPLIWDVVDDGDGQNEVIVVAAQQDESLRIQVLRHVRPVDEDAPATVMEVGVSDEGIPTFPRLGIANVRGLAYPRDIVSSEHENGKLEVWGWALDEEKGVNELERLYWADSFGASPYLKAKTHEFNWLDVDNDGCDEFFMNGLVDFRDANADLFTGNDPGVARFQIVDHGARHSDQVIGADWDPDRPGIEVLAVVEQDDPWTDALDMPTTHGGNLNLLYGLDPTGTNAVWLDTWDPAAINGLPSTDGQSIFGGNFTAALEGLEPVFCPKGEAGITEFQPPLQDDLTWSYACSIRTNGTVGDAFELLALDGAIYEGPTGSDSVLPSPSNSFKVRSGGPWRKMAPIDWDGDYASDEILHHPHRPGEVPGQPHGGPFFLWRMGEKEDWLPGPMPDGMPTMAEIAINTGVIPPDPGGSGGFRRYHYYQGDSQADVDAWAWNEGGPGVGGFYFQKLGEEFPGNGPNGTVRVRSYDILGDHREEVLALFVDNNGEPRFRVYGNTKQLPNGVAPRPSPRDSLAYRQWRQNPSFIPFAFDTDSRRLERFYLAPTNSNLPTSAVGIGHGGQVTLGAFVQYTNGDVVDVSLDTTLAWVADADVGTDFVLDPPVAAGHRNARHAGTVTTSARYVASMTFEGETIQSDPVYVFASNDDRPAVLRAGYGASWLAEGKDRALRIEAVIAQRGNAQLVVEVFNEDETPWVPFTGQAAIRLFDNGKNGDHYAGDGIYTRVIQDLAANGDLVSGFNFKVIQARTKFAQGGTIPTSDPWPYVVSGPGAPTLPWPTGASPNVGSFVTARVRSMGSRGRRGEDERLLEVELEPSPLDPDATLRAYAFVDGVWTLMTPRGGNVYTLVMPGTGAMTLQYDVASFAAISVAAPLLPSDLGPGLYLHAETSVPAGSDAFLDIVDW